MIENNLKHGIDFYIHKDVHIGCKNNTVFGDHVAVDKGFYCTTKLAVGDYVHIGPYVGVIGSKESNLILGNFCFIAIGSKVIAGSDDYMSSNLIGPLIPKNLKKVILSTVKFEDYSGCGANCIIMPGVVLSEGSLLLAGSVLNKDTKPWMIYAGNPARIIKARDREKVLNQARIFKSGEKYEEQN